MRESNYDLQVQAAQRSFAAYDLTEVGRRFSLPRQGDFLIFPFLGKDYTINIHTGQISDPAGEKAPFGVAMTTFDYLTNPYGPAVLSGQWCAHESMNAVRGGTLSGKLGDYSRLFTLFHGKKEQLREICQEMGATPADGGDYACVLPLMPGFPLLLRFWEADEDFPVQLQFLWDRLTPRYLHFETTYYTIDAILDRLISQLDK